MGGFVIQSQGTLLWVSLRIRRDTEPVSSRCGVQHRELGGNSASVQAWEGLSNDGRIWGGSLMIGVQVSADKREMENSEGSSTSPESSILAPAPESSGTPGNDPQRFLL